MICKSYKFFFPTKLWFGHGVTEHVAEAVSELGGHRVLFVTDKPLRRTGLPSIVEDALRNADVPFSVFDEVVPNPRDSNVESGFRAAQSMGADILVAMGGGSVIDTAKAIGVVMTHGGSINRWSGADTLIREIPPLIAIPTTAGTGSEVTPFAVITDTTAHIKRNIFDVRVCPKTALIDPDLLLGLPAPLMAACGMDALTHAVEAYTCKLAVPHTDAYALHAIRLIFENLIPAVEAPDKEKCEGLMLGSTIAGLAFGYSDVGAVHCIGEALGSKYDIPHGVAMAMLLPEVTAHNIPGAREKYLQISRILGGSSVEDCVRIFKDLRRTLGIGTISDLRDLKEDDFEELSILAEENVSNSSNPLAMDRHNYLALIKQIYLQGKE